MKLYVSGPMKGLPEENGAMFDRVATDLREAGFQIVSPAEMDREPRRESWTREQRLAEDIRMIADSAEGIEGLVVLPGWRLSHGAVLEIRTAQALKKPCWQAEIYNGKWKLGPKLEILAPLAGAHDVLEPIRIKDIRPGQFIPVKNYTPKFDQDEMERLAAQPRPFTPEDIEAMMPGDLTPVYTPRASKDILVPEVNWPAGRATISGFTVKDSGKRKQFASGMQRDTTEGKLDYLLALDGPMFERYAALMTAGAQKYDRRNWMKARGPEELERFKGSAIRHMLQWLAGDRTEDHAAAVIFNINGAEFVRDRIVEGQQPAKVQHPVEEG